MCIYELERTGAYATYVNISNNIEAVNKLTNHSRDRKANNIQCYNFLIAYILLSYILKNQAATNASKHLIRHSEERILLIEKCFIGQSKNASKYS